MTASRKPLLALLFLTAAVFTVTAQNKPLHPCAATKKANWQHQQKGAIASPLEDDYDVHYVKLEISANNLNTQIIGKTTTHAKVVAPSMSAYVFELDPQMTIDSAFFNGTAVSVSGSGDVRTIALASPLAAGAGFQAEIYYHGASAGGPSFFPKGLSNMTSSTWGNRVTFTLSEAYSAKDWWPSKQSLTDKIDSCDVWITVPGHLKAGSNGVLEAVVDLPDGKKQFQWKSRYPIDYYLISFAVANYIDYSYYQPLGGGDSVLIQNYVYSNPMTLPYFINEIDSVGLMLAYYSELFGRYPFWQEKYGHCMAPINGGMEHQTMTTQGNFDVTLSAHELGHQWFGDYVTCGSWADIWLNEGFAGYSEHLFLEHFHGPNAAAADMQQRHADIMSQPGGSIYVADTLNEERLFDGRLTYNKSAAVVHMLRYLANNDSLYFAGLRQYLQQHQHSTALTTDLKNILTATWGLNLDTFFTQWIQGEGYPTFSAAWNQASGIVYLELSQTTSEPASVPFFVTPIDIQLKSAAGDTTLRLTIHGNTGFFAIPWSKSMDGLAIDPHNWILNGTGAITHDPALSISETMATASLQLYPNPAHDAWQLREAPAGAQLQLRNLQGQQQWQGTADAQGQAAIPAGALPAGVYILEVKAKGAPAAYHRLLRQ